ELGDGEPPPGFPKADRLEEFLGRLGVRLGKQTVLFDAETAAFAEQAGDRLSGDAPVLVPPLVFDWRAGAGLPPGPGAKYAATFAGKPHPLKEALRLEARGLGRGQPFDLRLRHPRPVYYEPPGAGDKGRSLPPYD